MAAKLKVELRFIPIEGYRDKGLFVTIDGRQALHEGPRRVGQCVYCAGPCNALTTSCDVRVYSERRQG